MTRKSIPFDFPNARGRKLSGILDMPAGEPLFWGVFGPCFTCTKESHGAAKICRAFAEMGAAMLRFDTEGVGGSEGSLAETNFTTRINDLVSACNALEVPPKLLIGHSISGTAALSAAKHLPGLQAVAVVGSPCDPAYVMDKFERAGNVRIKGDMAEINVLGRIVHFKKSFIADMRTQHTAEDTAALTQKLFIFHAPHDDIVTYKNAEEIKSRAGANAELIPLDDMATHLFEQRADDARFVAETLMEWFRTHLA